MQSIREDEFYRQASLSQLLTGPDEQELTSFRPDVKDPLELVEATPELAGMLGSSLEFVDTRWDSLEASLPPTPPPPSSPRPLQRLSLRQPLSIPPFPPSQRQRATGAGAKVNNMSHHRSAGSGQLSGFKNVEYSAPAAKTENKMVASMWEPKQPGCKNTSVHIPAKPNMTINDKKWEPQRQSKSIGIAKSANAASKNDSCMWEPQRQQSKSTWIPDSANSDSKIHSSMWEQQRQRSKDTETDDSVNPDASADFSTWEEPKQGNKSTRTPASVKSDGAVGASIWEPQRLRSKNAVNSDSVVDAVPSEPQQTRNKNPVNAANSNGSVDVNMWKRPAAVLDSTNTNTDTAVKCSVWEPQRLRSKNAGLSPAKPKPPVDTNMWELQGVNRASGVSTAPKQEATSCNNQGPAGKTIKMDTAWQKNLGNVRVHIRDLGMKVGEGVIHRDMKKEQGKPAGRGAKVKTRS